MSRRVKSRDFRSRAIRMPGDFAHLANLPFHFSDIPRHRKLDDMNIVRLQELAGRALIEQTGDHDIGLEHQQVLGAA